MDCVLGLRGYLGCRGGVVPGWSVLDSLEWLGFFLCIVVLFGIDVFLRL